MKFFFLCFLRHFYVRDVKIAEYTQLELAFLEYPTQHRKKSERLGKRSVKYTERFTNSSYLDSTNLELTSSHVIRLGIAVVVVLGPSDIDTDKKRLYLRIHAVAHVFFYTDYLLKSFDAYRDRKPLIGPN